MVETPSKGRHPMKNRLLEHAAACALMAGVLVVGGCATTQKLENAVLSDSVPYAGDVSPTVAPPPAPVKSPWVEKVEAVAQEKQKAEAERRPGTTFAEKVVSRRKSALEMLVAPLLPGDDGEKPETTQNFAEKAAAAAVKEEEQPQEMAAAEAELPPLSAEPVLPEDIEAEAAPAPVAEPVAVPASETVSAPEVAAAPEAVAAPEPAPVPAAAEPVAAAEPASAAVPAEATEAPKPVEVAAAAPAEVPPAVSGDAPLASNWVQKLRMAAGRKAEIVTEKQLTEGGVRVAAVPPIPVVEQEPATAVAEVAPVVPPAPTEAAEAPKPSSWAERLATLAVARQEPKPEPETPVAVAEAPVVEPEAPVVAAVEPVAEPVAEVPVVAAEPLPPAAEPEAPMVVAAAEPVPVVESVGKKPDFVAGQQIMLPPGEDPNTSKWVKDFRTRASVPSVQEETPAVEEPVEPAVEAVPVVAVEEPAVEPAPAPETQAVAEAPIFEAPVDTGVPEVLSVPTPVEAHPELPEVMAVQNPVAASPELPEVVIAQQPSEPASEAPEVAVAVAPVVEVAEKPVPAKPKKRGSLLFGSAPEKWADPGIPLFFVEQEQKPVRGVDPSAVMTPLLEEMPDDVVAPAPAESEAAWTPGEEARDDEAMAEGYPSLASVPPAPAPLSDREVLLRDMMKSDHEEGMKMISDADLPQLEIRTAVEPEPPLAEASAPAIEAVEPPLVAVPVVVEEALVQPEEAPVVIEEAPVSIHEPTAEMTEVLESAAKAAAADGLVLHDPETPRALKDYDSADTSVSLLAGVVRFEHASMGVGDDYRRILADVARLQGNTGGFLRVVGHASRKADAPDALKEMMVNFSLSIDRANVVAAELIKMGVPADHIFVGAKGQSEPAGTPNGEETEEDSRRTEIYLDY